MAACSHYVSNRADHDRAKKRGGGRTPISIDRLKAEGRYGREPSHDQTAERLFERQWGLTLLAHVLARLEAEMTDAGKSRRFTALQPALLGAAEQIPYREVAAALGLTEEAARAAARRLRRRYRELLREEVARTLDDPADVDGEIPALSPPLAAEIPRGPRHEWPWTLLLMMEKRREIPKDGPMAESHACPECRGSLPPDAPRGLCPRCLMEAAVSATEAWRPGRTPRGGGPPAVAWPLDIQEFRLAILNLGLMGAEELETYAAAASVDVSGLARAWSGPAS